MVKKYLDVRRRSDEFALRIGRFLPILKRSSKCPQNLTTRMNREPQRELWTGALRSRWLVRKNLRVLSDVQKLSVVILVDERQLEVIIEAVGYKTSDTM